MKKKQEYTFQVSQNLFESIQEYCSLNGLDMNQYVEELLHKNFMVDKYGDAPSCIVKKKDTKVEEQKISEPIPVKEEVKEPNDPPKVIKRKIKTY